MDERDLLVGKHIPESESSGLNNHSQGGCVPPNPCSLVGSLVDGRFRIDELLGIGGMACIYRAEQVYLKKLVALKILHPVFANSASSVERFQREAQIAVHLKSPHVVDVLDFGRTSDGRVFLAMELLKGETLHVLIEREGRLTPARTVALLRQLLSGLQAAHEMGIVHRDIKPENIWLVPTPEGEQLKLLDFGIAKLLQP
jgi:serine/threonine-protein kinase